LDTPFCHLSHLAGMFDSQPYHNTVLMMDHCQGLVDKRWVLALNRYHSKCTDADFQHIDIVNLCHTRPMCVANRIYTLNRSHARVSVEVDILNMIVIRRVYNRNVHPTSGVIASRQQ
jgi:hypothetical protein